MIAGGGGHGVPSLADTWVKRRGMECSWWIFKKNDLKSKL